MSRDKCRISIVVLKLIVIELYVQIIRRHIGRRSHTSEFRIVKLLLYIYMKVV
jgi:hypothetical protein